MIDRRALLITVSRLGSRSEDTTPSNAEIRRLAMKCAIAFLTTNLVGENGYQHILTPGLGDHV